MITYDDLVKYLSEHVIGRSTTYPHGWVDVKTLEKITKEIKEQEPLPWSKKYK